MGPVYFELQDLLWEVREKHSLLMEAAKMWKEYDRAGAFKRDIAAILGEGWEDKVQVRQGMPCRSP